MTTRDQAAEQLRIAQRIESTATSFNPVWITYVAMCAAATFYVWGKVWAPDSLVPMWLTMSWVLAFVALIGVFAIFSPTARRGFGKRWTVMMALWTITWAGTILWTMTQTAAIAFSAIYLALAIGGPIWEGFANRVQR